MFDSFNGLPLHALVLHTVVIAVPLATLLAILFGIPRTRSWARDYTRCWHRRCDVRHAASGAGKALGIRPGIGGNRSRSTHRLVPAADHHRDLFAVLRLRRPCWSRGPASVGEAPGSGIALPLLIATGLVMSLWVVRVGDLGAVRCGTQGKTYSSTASVSKSQRQEVSFSRHRSRSLPTWVPVLEASVSFGDCCLDPRSLGMRRMSLARFLLAALVAIAGSPRACTPSPFTGGGSGRCSPGLGFRSPSAGPPTAPPRLPSKQR